MSASRPIQCLFAKAKTPSRLCPRRTFQTGTRLQARRTPKHKSIKASDLGLVKRKASDPELTAEDLRPYSENEKAALAKRYTPEQLAAIEAGEAAVDLNDLAEQGAAREDAMKLNYLDDFSSIHPVVDKPVRAPEENYDPNLRFKTEDELAGDLTKWVKDLPDEPTRLDWMKFMDNTRLTVGKPEAELNPRSYLAPEIPKLDILKRNVMGNEEIDPATRRLMRQTGFDSTDIRRIRVKQLIQHRVTNQTRLGRISSYYYLAVAGNGKGLIGIGEGKSSEHEEARQQARSAAIRNMQPIPMYEGRTIFGDVKGKVSATEVELMTRPPGFGVRCQSLIFEICRCAGIQDMAARVTRSRNHMNTVKATLQALLSQRLPEEIARARGRKLVDVRKVYYGGNL
ncbi:MAG: hypothetical protein LQ339_006519 [Xanthoria mediterranea]|nr:MAG: hypothetical protein LQ339_006519 [Xanthoria mediterranea]